LMATWREVHPDFRYTLFDDVLARAFLSTTYPGEVLRAYLRSSAPAQKADLFRLAWLFAKGGCYADADDRCRGRIDSIIPNNAVLALYQEEYGTVANNFIAVVPRHPVIGLALKLATAAINRGDRDLLWLSTGPGLLTRALVQVMTRGPIEYQTWQEQIVIFDRWIVRKVISPHCLATYKKTHRHWSRSALGKRSSKSPAISGEQIG